ncbi:NAD(P)-binding protein [Mycena alexandri]|uniref:NAD(P)-binding protein n=1 Tax=Mycena alexandri TaxID=1745969 RepID=A0AAD6WYS1_9AGAR|nr:NAD(P)-binding protein [Mycena alexandri]
MPSLAVARAANAAWNPSYTPVGVFVGGTSGIGQGIAEAFARHTKGNAHIFIVGRNRAAATAILARLDKPPAGTPELTREFLHCDLSLIGNAKRTAATIIARFPRVNVVFLTAGEISLKGVDVSEEGVDRQMSALYYSKWAFIDALRVGLRAAAGAGEDARVAAVHTAGRGGPIDLEDLGLMKSMRGGMAGVRKLLPQLASYQDLMAEGFAERDTNISFMHNFPGTVDTPLLRKSPSAALRAVHYVRFLLFPTLMFRAMSISDCGEYQLYGLLQARPGASRAGGDGEDIGMGGEGDVHWGEGRELLWAHSEKVVGAVVV